MLNYLFILICSCQTLKETDLAIIWRNLDEPDRNRLRNEARKYADEHLPSCEMPKWRNIYKKNLHARIMVSHPADILSTTYSIHTGIRSWIIPPPILHQLILPRWHFSKREPVVFTSKPERFRTVTFSALIHAYHANDGRLKLTKYYL
jgi:hypothetical protein